MMLSRRRLMLALLLVGLMVLGALGFLLPVSADIPEALTRPLPDPEPHAFPVQTSRAWRGSLVHWVHANGFVRPARTLELTSRIAGTLVSVRVREGERVRRGDTLLMIDDGEYRLALERARVTLLGAQIEYRTLAASPFLAHADTASQTAEVRRAEQRLAEIASQQRAGGWSEEESLRIRREATASLAYATLRREDVLAHRSGLALAQELAERARRDLDAAVIRAPFAGEVADCALTPFSDVSRGQRLLTLVDLDTAVIEAEILEHDIAAIRPRQSARILPASISGVELEGTVTACNPLPDPVHGTYRVTITVVRAGGVRLRPGMVSEVRIATAIEPDTVLVPLVAVVRREGKPVVFVVQEARARWRYVQTGPSNGEEICILNGVTAGEEVITGGHFVLAHDARVTASSDDPARDRSTVSALRFRSPTFRAATTEGGSDHENPGAKYNRDDPVPASREFGRGAGNRQDRAGW